MRRLSIAIIGTTAPSRCAHYADMTQETASSRLKRLRSEAGLSIREMAELLGFGSTSGYSHYEYKLKEPVLPWKLRAKITEVLSARGADNEDIRLLFETGEGASYPERIGLAEPQAPMIDTSKIPDRLAAPSNGAADKPGLIQLAIVGSTIQVAATVDANGVDELIRRLQLAKDMIRN